MTDSTKKFESDKDFENLYCSHCGSSDLEIIRIDGNICTYKRYRCKSCLNSWEIVVERNN